MSTSWLDGDAVAAALLTGVALGRAIARGVSRCRGCDVLIVGEAVRALALVVGVGGVCSRVDAESAGGGGCSFSDAVDSAGAGLAAVSGLSVVWVAADRVSRTSHKIAMAPNRPMAAITAMLRRGGVLSCFASPSLAGVLEASSSVGDSVEANPPSVVISEIGRFFGGASSGRGA